MEDASPKTADCTVLSVGRAGAEVCKMVSGFAAPAVRAAGADFGGSFSCTIGTAGGSCAGGWITRTWPSTMPLAQAARQTRPMTRLTTTGRFLIPKPPSASLFGPLPSGASLLHERHENVTSPR